MINKTNVFVLVIFCIILLSCSSIFRYDTNVRTVASPDGSVKLTFTLLDEQPTYSMSYKDTEIIENSSLGYRFKTLAPLLGKFELDKMDERSFSETWETVWGERRKVDNNYNELMVYLSEKEGAQRKLNVYFRVFNDGIGFRYEIPEQEGLTDLQITSEETAFNFPKDHSIWFQPCDTLSRVWENGYNTYERLYENSKVSELSTLVHTPVTIETDEGVFITIHEANLTDYPSMVLTKGKQAKDLKSDLVPWPDGVKVKTTAPMKSPWRTIQVSDKLSGLVESDMILNLNEPNVIEDVSWIQPMKYIGIWWEMHLNKSTWESGPRHGANTENTVKYIDFAAENGFGGVLVEGWNTGWEVWTTAPDFSFVNPYPDYDLDYLAKYSKEKGVGLIGHHETSGDAEAYEKQIEEAFQLMEDKGIHALKTGYVGYIRPTGQNHHGQWMVKHYRRVLELAAKHKINLVAHEPIKPTGIRRTYPNMLSREAMRGMEYNAWSSGNPPEHMTILAYTMMLAGPLDYTPGIFQANLDQFRKGNSIHTTVANQLALYVVIFSPVQMAADLPEHYQGNPAFQFIKDVAVNWETSRLIDGEIGDYVVTARKQRGSDDWFLGAITDENPRDLVVSFDFLDEGKTYVAEIYEDAENASFNHNPELVDISKHLVSSTTKHKLKLAPGGGQAIRFRPAVEEDLKTLNQL
ncbi:MAG: glycoside hydrolase family 97 protein [Marinoscillum sp.]